ncbi:hypothetical protein KORDIASMS9_03119 [Kordia sp. SMS9]|uniref:hypothetical protein n=1 Tax=Kordia sp. SMS9 TaxID=2282170 RepID=UPI000E105C89|nr:hypothetical protein [Kordia sp. SMS9]AXG70869.1 hypothetical protein KORDIASMS9_03119 [Kordia sp. SMS9]
MQKVTNITNKQNCNFRNKLTLSQKNEISEGIEELNQGKRVSYDEFLKKIY